jgi:hypothetical protein
MYLNTYMEITSIQTIFNRYPASIELTHRNYVHDPITLKNTIESVTYVYSVYDKKATIDDGPAAHTVDVRV